VKQNNTSVTLKNRIPTQPVAPNPRGQGTFEYVLLLGGVLLIVVLAIVVLQSSFFQSAKGVSDIELKKCKLSAQQTPACFTNAQFDGSKTFNMLGYQANPLRCDCTDFNPNAFTVSVGQAPLKTLDFSSSKGGFSSLRLEEATATPSVDSAPVTAYAVSVVLPVLPDGKKYEFFLVLKDQTIKRSGDEGFKEPTLAALPNGLVAYSFTDLPAGSRIKINPPSTFSNEQVETAKQSKSESPAPQELEKQAVEMRDALIDQESSFKLIKGPDGRLRGIYTLTLTEDYSGPLTITLPLASTRITKTHPASSGIKPHAETPDVSVVSWDLVNLKAGKAFRVIIELTQDVTVQQAANEVNSKTEKVKGKRQKKGNGCPRIPLINVELPFGCSTPAGSPSPSPSAGTSVVPSATAKPSVASCIASGQGCAATSLLPGSIDKKCCSSLSCQSAGEGLGALLTWQCLPEKEKPSATPIPQCLLKGKSCIPGYSDGGTCCTGLVCSWKSNDFECMEFVPEVSPPPAVECVSNGQGCGLIGGTICCGGLTCRNPDTGENRLNVLQCLPKKDTINCVRKDKMCVLGGSPGCCSDLSCIPNAKGGLSCQKPGSTDESPTPEPFDMSKIHPIDSQPWQFLLPDKPKASPSPTVPPQLAKIGKTEVPSLAKVNEECGPGVVEGQTVTCVAGLECFAEDPPLANSRTICQTPETKKLYTAARSEWRFETAAAADSSTISLESTELPVDDLIKAAGGKGFSIPENGFIRDKNGFLYVVFQQPSVKTTDKSNGVSQWVVQSNLAMSNDEGKTWKFLKTQTEPILDTFSRAIGAYSIPPGPITRKSCVSFGMVDRTSTDYSKIKYHGCFGGDKECQKKYGSCSTDHPGEDNYERLDPVFNKLFIAANEEAQKEANKCGLKPLNVRPGCLNSIRWPVRIYCKTWEDTCNPPKITESYYGCLKETDIFEPTPSATPTPFTPRPLYADTNAVFHQTEFQGLAPNPKGGVFSYYRIFSTEISSRGKNQLTTMKNTSELHVIEIDEKGNAQNRIISSKSMPILDESMRFVGSNGGVQFFTENKKLFYSEDGGNHLISQGNAGYVDISWLETKNLPNRCENGHFFPAIREGLDVEKVVPLLDFYKVAGGKIIGFDGYIPVVQEADGYFPNINAIFNKYYDTESYYASYEKYLSQYLKNKYFNKEFYDRYYTKTKGGIQSKFSRMIEKDVSVDSVGNLHLAFHSSNYFAGSGRKEFIYYQFFPASSFDPKSETAYDQVYFFSKSNCPACLQTKDWLESNKIPFKENPELTGLIKEKISTALEKATYPVTVIRRGADETAQYSIVYGNDSIRISSELGIILDPVLIESWSPPTPVIPKNKVIQKLPLKMYLSSENTPILWISTLQKQDRVERYTYQKGSFQKNYSKFDFITNSVPKMLSDYSWFDVYRWEFGITAGQLLKDFATFKDSLDPRPHPNPRYSSVSLKMPSGHIHQSPDQAVILAFDKATDGVLWPDDPRVPRHHKASVYYDNYYTVYSMKTSEQLTPEPTAGAVLSELVPYQKLQLPIPVSSTDAPTITISSEPSGLATAVVAKDDEGGYYADVTIDARSYLKGGKLDIAGATSVSGKVVAKIGKQSVDMPFDVSVKHVAPENIAYATPDKLTFYTYKGKGVTKQIFLVNNFNRPLSFACTGVFSAAVPGNSIATVDVKPPAQTTECAVTLDGVATRKRVILEVISDSFDPLFTREHSLAPRADVTGRTVRLKDCGNGYCNCQQVRAALTDFENLVATHTSRIKAGATEETVAALFTNGFKETAIIRTGLFEDLDEEQLGTCPANIAGWTADLKPGRVYRVSLFVPQSNGNFYWQSRTPEDPEEILKPFSYASWDGIKSDAFTFSRLYGVS